MKFIKILVIVLIAILISSCSKRDNPFIDGFILKSIYYGDTTWMRRFEVFDVDGLPMVPIVKLNGDEVELDVDYSDYLRCYYYDEVPFLTSNEYQLTVDHYYGQARAKIWMPGEFSMISPDLNYILGRDSVLSITWHKSDKATWYWLSLELEYEYEDTADDWDTYEFYQDTILDDTIIQYPRRYFFPDYVKQIIGGDAIAGVWACDGPKRWVSGSRGNIQGQGFGYFYSIYEPQELEFYVGAPLKEPKLRNSSEVRDRLKEKIKKRYN